MKIPVVAAGRGSPRVLSGQAKDDEPPETMIGLREEGTSPEPTIPGDVDWLTLTEQVEPDGNRPTVDIPGAGEMDTIHRRLSSDVVIVSVRVGGSMTWSDSRRLMDGLQGEGRLLLSVLAGPYSGEDKPSETTLREVRKVPDFFLPVNTPSVLAARAQANPAGAENTVPRYLSRIVRALRARLGRADRLTTGLRGLLDMTPHEKRMLLKLQLKGFLKENFS